MNDPGAKILFNQVIQDRLKRKRISRSLFR